MPKVAKKIANQKRVKVAGKPKTSLAKIGRDLGSYFGPTGAVLGGLAGKAISRITGMGDYTVKGNTLIGGQAPQFVSTGAGMRICHREFVTDVNSTTAFTNANQYYINPGNSTLFRWLSSVALNFESYELHGLVFTYKPTSGTAISGTSAAMGSVILSTEYDVLKPQFTSKQEAEAYMFTTVSVPYSGMMHPVECAPNLTVLPKKFITPALSPLGLDSDDDPRLHYHGLTQVMTAGQQSFDSIVGELWVSYDITLYVPRPSLSSSTTCYTIGQYTGTVQANPVPNSLQNSILTCSNASITYNTFSGGRYLPTCRFNRAGLYLLETVAGWFGSGSGSNVEFTGTMIGSTAAYRTQSYDPELHESIPRPELPSTYANMAGSAQCTIHRTVVDILDPRACSYNFATFTLVSGVSSSTFNVGYSAIYIGPSSTFVPSFMNPVPEMVQGKFVGLRLDKTNVDSEYYSGDPSYVSLSNLRPPYPGEQKSVNRH